MLDAPALAGAHITANPNPVPPGTGAASTTISWTTGDSAEGKVYVTVDNGPPQLFSAGARGSQDAPWIGAGSVYEFRLYGGNARRKLLAKVQVERLPQ